MRRFPPSAGVNLACAFGDQTMTYRDQAAVSHKPDCSLLQLQKGDIILLGCDGVFDFAGIQELIDTVIGPFWNEPHVNLAELISIYAMMQQEMKGGTDNVTAIIVRVSSEIEIRVSQASTEIQ